MAFQEGDILTNDQGQQVVLNNNQWVPVPTTPQGFTSPQDPSIGDTLQRQLGLTARAGVQGLTGLPSLLAEVPRQALNLIPGVDFPPQQQAISQLLTNLGAPLPENALERIVGGSAEALAGTGGILGLGKAIAPTLPAAAENILTAPALQAATAITGGGSSQLAQEAGVGPTGQLAAGFGASLLTPSIISKGQKTIQNLITPGSGHRRTAEKLVENALKRDLIPEDAPLAANRLGVEANMVDVSGPNVKQLAQSVSQVF